MSQARTKCEQALLAMPILLEQLDDDGKTFLGQVIQAAIETGYNDGYADGKSQERLDVAETEYRITKGGVVRGTEQRPSISNS